MTHKITGYLERIVEYAFLGCVLFFPFSKAALEICVVGGILCWILLKLLKREGLTDSGKLGLLLIAFVLSSSISAFYSGYPVVSAKGVLRLLKYTLLMLAAADFYCRRVRFKKLTVVALAAFLAVILDSFYQLGTGKDLIGVVPTYPDLDQVRLTGPFKSYGLLAAYVIALVPMTAAFALRNGKGSGLRKLFWTFFCVAAVYILYKTHSRGAWIAGFCSWLFFAFLIRSKWITAILLLGLAAAPFVIPREALIHLDLFHHEQSWVERKLLWKRALHVIQARPLFGCGINTYVRNYPKYTATMKNSSFEGSEHAQLYANFPPEERWRIPGDPSHIPDHYVHNGYLQLAAESGLIALALFLTLILSGLKSGFGVFKRSVGDSKILMAGLLAGFIALLLQAGIDTTLHNLQPATLIWLFLGLLFAVGKEIHPSFETR